MSLTITDPSFDKIYTMYAWRDNNVRLVFTQGEGLSVTDGTVAHVKTPKFQLRDDRGIIDLTSCEVSLALTRPDGTEDLLSCSSASGEAAQGIISCPITASATAIAGQAIGEIRVLSSSAGNPTAVIKFFGVHLKIYKGVSDAAAEQSAQFSELTTALRKVALLTPESTAELDDAIEEDGENPVASGLIYDALAGKMNFVHEEDKTKIDECTAANTVYRIFLETDYVSYADANVICVRSTNKHTQYAFTRSGLILYREKYTNDSAGWHEWKRIPTYEIMFDTVVRDLKDATPDVTFNIHNTKVDTFLQTAAYDSSDYSYSNLPTADSTNWDRPNTLSINIPSNSSKFILYDTITRMERVESTSGTTHIVDNLIPNRNYAYTVRKSDGSLLSHGIIKAIGQVRMINAGGDDAETDRTFNIRDLGGWTANGGKLKYGLVYRGGELNDSISINSTQQLFFKNVLGIRNEIDLRDSGGNGVGATALGVGVNYYNFATGYSPNILGESDTYAKKRADVIKQLAKNIKNGEPTYIHCQAGADRTSVICTFVKAICGVSQSDIDRDHELSYYSYQADAQRIRKRNNSWDNGHRVMINGKGTESYSQPYINNMEGTSFQDKIVRLLLRSGVTIDELNDIRFGLIDGNPTALVNPYGNATITTTLTNVYADKSISKTALYQPLEVNLYPKDGYVLSSVTLTMGGSNIKSACYSDGGRIKIPRVTGDVVITAQAVSITGGSQIVSGVVNANGTITFTDSDGNTFTTTGASVIGPQGDDYVLTAQDKSDIADIVLGELPTTQGVLYGNTSN